jgi:hypothetical protein
MKTECELIVSSSLGHLKITQNQKQEKENYKKKLLQNMERE